MLGTKSVVCALLCVGLSWAGDPPHSGPSQGKPRVDFARVPLSFEPNLGQSDPSARFIAKSPGYTLHLEPAGVSFQLNGRDKASVSLRMDLENANRQAQITGESPLPGKANYIPTNNPRTWVTDVPTYSRVHYSSVYPGVDVVFYGAANRLEYDFLVQPGADPAQIRMQLSGANSANINNDGDLVLPIGKGDLRFLKPLVYQLSGDGKTRELVDARYQIERKVNGAPMVTFTLAKYDHHRQLVIDPAFESSYSEYLSYTHAGTVGVDGSGNTYVTGASNNGGFYISKFNSSGTLVFNTLLGTGNNIYPYGIAVSNSGQAYVTGEIYISSTVPTSANAYQTTVTGSYNAFLVDLSADGTMVPYATYVGGTNTSESWAQGVAVDSGGNAYLAGYTYSSTFPTTSGAYQTTFSASFDGFVSKLNPTAATGPASLVYSTLLGKGNTGLNAIAVDSSGDAYVTGNAPSTFPVTAGAFRYTGDYSGSGGVYVTEVNPTGTALVYSAYLGYGTGYGIAVEGQTNPSVYVTGAVSGADFPVTAGAYQTTYAGGFLTKLNSTGTAEVYSTFLGGPSSYAGNGVSPISVALPNGCLSSCNAYVAGWTNTTDFPAINPIDATASTTAESAFVAEIAANGASALFSSYLNGVKSGVYAGLPNGNYGSTPAVAVDSSGNMSVVGNIEGTSDFPITIPNSNPADAFVARIAAVAAPFTFASPTTVSFGNQPVGVSTSIYNGSPTVRLNNFSSTAATLSPIQVSPSTVFSESDNCGGTVAAGGYCTLTLNFTPNAPSTFNGTATITSNASDSPTVITLTGTGTNSAFAEPSQTSLTFGNQAVGTTSAAQTVTITNLGNITTVLNVTVSTSDFAAVNNCPSELLPGAMCTASVTFTPTQAGLRTDTLTISSTGGPNASVPLSGSGTISGGTSSITLSTASLQFNPQLVNTTSATQLIYVTNSGSFPVAVQNYTASGDFTVANYDCGNFPFQLTPQQSCYVQITFSPTTSGTRTGTLTITDSATGSPQMVSLSGTGVASTENVEFYPSSSLSFQNTPVGVTSANAVIYFYNTGTSPITVDRAVVSGGSFALNGTTCEASTVTGILEDGNGGGYCYVYVSFTPTAAGPQAGTITFTDSAPGSPHVVNLTGNGIAATGTITLSPNGANYNTQPQGTTSAVQYIYLVNPGNTPVTVNSWSFSGPDYSASISNCGSTPFNISAGSTGCYVPIQFTPTTTGTLTETLTVDTTAGNQMATLTGVGQAATQAIGLTPTSMNLGSIVMNQDGPYEYVYIRNTGTDSVTFTAAPTITGANAADFPASYSCATLNYALAAGKSCFIQIRFTPTTTMAESATLTLTDSAGTQMLALSGTGVSAKPTFTLSDYLISFNSQLQGTTSPLNTYIYFYNNGATAQSLGNVGLTGTFIIPPGYNTCNGQTVAANSSCYVYLEFAPTSAGYQTGALTFNDNTGNPLAGLPSVPLAGYANAPTYSGYINPTGVDFTSLQVIGTTSTSQIVYLYNTGNTSFTVGTVTGTDFGLAGPSAEFSTASANGGDDYCSGVVVAAASSCYVYITFTPNAAGARTGSITFPVTYGNATMTTFTGTLSGTGAAEIDAAVLTPPSASYLDQVVGTVSAVNIYYLRNNGNQPFNVGTLVNSNSAEFSTASVNNGSDTCSGQKIAVAGSCYIYVAFTPTAVGPQTGTITFPVTYADKTVANLVLTFSGNGVAAAPTVRITPSSLQFPTELQSVTTAIQSLTVLNTGNATVNIGMDSISTNSEFEINSDSCKGINLTVNGSCTVNVTFTPSAAATGVQTGALTIADNAAGGPHLVPLSGTAITLSQQIVQSQPSLAFGNQPAGSPSSAQVVYFSNQSDSNLSITSTFALGGANPADFTINSNTCTTTFTARSSCHVSVEFTPPSGASGPLTATISETDAGTPGSHTITVTGTAVAPGPAATFTPSTLTFTTQDVGTTSAAQYFSVTNTGSANLTITAVASTNATEFPISTDSCSGVTLTPNQHCVVSVAFSPLIGHTRSGSIQVTDNATGSPQSVALTGTGYGIPELSFTPTSLTFASTNINATSATQTITLKDTGTDYLGFSGITIAGVNSSEFTITNNTCSTYLAPAGTCVLTISFKPTASGPQGAYVVVSDNANNVTGSIQIAALSGTGVAVPAAGVSPTTLTYTSTNVGATSAAQTSTITNSGTGPLTITSITIGGTNSGDYAETNTCGATLVAGANCIISVTFTPTAAGTRSAAITITDNANNVSGTTQTINLSGTGAGIPAAAVAPTTVVFPNQNVGVLSAAQTIILSNSGTAALTVSNIAISGTNGSDFGTTNNCMGSVAIGGNCSIFVTFTPGAPGSRSAVLTVTDNAGNVTGSMQMVVLTGTGIGVPVAGVTPASLTFSGAVGVATAAQTVTVSNTGTGPLTITSIVIGGANPTDFGETTTCGATVAVGANCTISVTFTAAAAGAFTANLHVIDNSGNTGATQTVTLNGTGTTASGPPTVVSLSPASGNGLTQAFTMVYSDPAGISDLSEVLVLFNPTVAVTNDCAVVYVPSTNLMYLYGNTGTLLATGVTPGGATSVSNSQCTLNGTGSSFSTSVDNLTLTANITFAATFTGTKDVYLEAVGKTQNSGWVMKGTWLPATAGPPTIVSLTPTSGSGTAQTFTVVSSDPNGTVDLSGILLLFNPTLAVANGCYVDYNPVTNLLYLYNNAGTAALTPAVAPESTTTVSNSQCTLNGTGSSFSTSGNNLTLNVSLTFSGTFTASQNVYIDVLSKTQSSGWAMKGTWTP